MTTINKGNQMHTLAKDCAAAMLEAIPAAMRVIRRHMRSHRLSGVSVPQLRVLAFLDRYGPATLSDVAEHVGTTLPSMSRMIQSLVEGRLVRRRAGSPDRRAVRLEIAATGRRVLEMARKATVEQLARQIGSLSVNEVRQLKKAMSLLLRVVAPGHGQSGPQEKVARC
jgi:DNA-binding MarR family transcriptional regulator